MRYGVIGVSKLSENQKDELLTEIIDKCVKYAGDSYEDFAIPVIKLLKSKKLVEYGE